MSQLFDSFPYPQLVVFLGMFPAAFSSFLPEPFGAVLVIAAWGTLSVTSWYVGRRLGSFGWLLFSMAAGVLLSLGVANDMLTLTALFSLLACGLCLVFADLYYNSRYEADAAT